MFCSKRVQSVTSLLSRVEDCPHIPFHQLKSDDAMARLSRCRPISGIKPAHVEDGVVRYAHNTGEVNFRRRAPLQLASTLGFILNKRSGKFLGLTPEERAALHECLTWLRQPGNNALCFYGQELENFDIACKKLMTRIKHVIPEGCKQARIRATTRVSRKLEDGTIGETLGDEARGMARAVVASKHVLIILHLCSVVLEMRVLRCISNACAPLR